MRQAPRRFLRTDVGSADRALALMACLGAFLSVLATTESLTHHVTVGPWWWRSAHIVLVVAILVAAVGSLVLPIPLLLALLRCIAVAGPVLTTVWVFTTTDQAGPLPWTFDVLGTFVWFAAAGWSWRGATIYVVLTALSLPVLSWGGIAAGPEGMTRTIPLVLTNLGFVAVFHGIRVQLLNHWKAAAAAGAQQSLLARSRAELLERERVGAFLHDEVLTSLLAIGVNGGADPLVRAQAQHTLTRLHQELADLPPPGDQELGAALRNCAARWLPEVVVEEAAVGPINVPAEVAEILLAAASEAMRNSLRHAATGLDRPVRRWVTLAQVSHDVVIDVGDDGRGFDTGAVDPQRMGVRDSIFGRLDRLDGGSAAIVPVKPSGTCVQLRWRRP